MSLLLNVYPEHNWEPWRFSKTPNAYFKDLKNQRKFLDWAGKQLKLKNTSDWYNVSLKVDLLLVYLFIYLFKQLKDIDKRVINIYRGSMAQMLRTIYPEYEWEFWRFSKVPAKYWENENNYINFIKWLEIQLGVKNRNDWFGVKYAVT